MVKYTNHYINLVVLGSFNPAILTHDFLTKECKFSFGVEPKVQQMPIPVVSSIDYGNIGFFADLGRLQISENGCADPDKSSIPQYLQTYLGKLPYTPLKKCGANFSYELLVDPAKLGTVHLWLEGGRKNFPGILGLAELGLEISFDVTKAAEQIKTWTVRAKDEKRKATTMAKFHYSGDGSHLYVDFNFDVDDLEKDRRLMNSITTDYCKVFDLFKNQVESIFN